MSTRRRSRGRESALIRPEAEVLRKLYVYEDSTWIERVATEMKERGRGRQKTEPQDDEESADAANGDSELTEPSDVRVQSMLSKLGRPKAWESRNPLGSALPWEADFAKLAPAFKEARRRARTARISFSLAGRDPVGKDRVFILAWYEGGLESIVRPRGDGAPWGQSALARELADRMETKWEWNQDALHRNSGPRKSLRDDREVAAWLCALASRECAGDAGDFDLLDMLRSLLTRLAAKGSNQIWLLPCSGCDGVYPHARSPARTAAEQSGDAPIYCMPKCRQRRLDQAHKARS